MTYISIDKPRIPLLSLDRDVRQLTCKLLVLVRVLLMADSTAWGAFLKYRWQVTGRRLTFDAGFASVVVRHKEHPVLAEPLENSAGFNANTDQRDSQSRRQPHLFLSRYYRLEYDFRSLTVENRKGLSRKPLRRFGRRSLALRFRVLTARCEYIFHDLVYRVV